MINAIIIGTGKTADIAYQYLKNDYNIVGFAQTITEAEQQKNNLPVYPISSLTKFSRNSFKIFVAIGTDKLNTTRQKIYENLKQEGWKFITYIHPRATVSPTATIGENCLVMEENVIQDYVTIEDNNILWSGNHIGHHSRIGSHNFISSHVIISGSCNIGNNNFFGINSCVGDEVTIGNYNWFSPLTSTIKNIGNEQLFIMPKSEISKISTKKFFRVP